LNCTKNRKPTAELNRKQEAQTRRTKMITILDYNMGNVGSIANMIKKAGGSSIITSDTSNIASATKLILPGVGAFDNGMLNLRQSPFFDILNHKVLKDKTPILGICLGMQLMTKSSEEGKEPGLGWINANTVRFNFENNNPKPRVPHMGWNSVYKNKNHQITDNIIFEDSRYYFVHSYYVKCHNQNDILLTCNYFGNFTAAFQKDNIIGVQFHPEKSHKFGMQLISNFINL